MMMDLDFILVLLLKCVFAFLMVSVVMSMAGYSVLAERKVSAWMQGGGPNRTVLPFVSHIPIIGPLLGGWACFSLWRTV